MIRNLEDVVNKGLCVGCGLCSALYSKKFVTMSNFKTLGNRPIFSELYKNRYMKDNKGLNLCPGYKQDLYSRKLSPNNHPLIGGYIEIWEGYASDEETRNNASSGGIISALSQYCLEKEQFYSVLHTKKSDIVPWRNESTFSVNIEQLRAKSGSRYAPSSPCEYLHKCEKNKKYVFIGKPCDCAGVRNWERIESESPFGLIIGFFCAGVPTEVGSLMYFEDNDINSECIVDNIYRSHGWPGQYQLYSKNDKIFEASYMDSWKYLQKYRHFRCQLCPDGLSEQSDISTGDAWHRLNEERKASLGESIIIIRTERGRRIFHEAMESGYLTCYPSSVENVISGQGLTERKKEIWGRISTLKLFGMPYPQYNNFQLFRSWYYLSFYKKIKSFLSTIKRIVSRGMLFRRSLNKT